MAKSEIWKYFDLRKDTEDGCKLGMCRVCDNDDPSVFRLTGKSTSPLWKHLEKCHPEEHSKVKKIQPSTGNDKSKKKIIQPTLDDMINRQVPYGPNHRKQKEFDDKFKDLIVNDCLPFNIADSKFFRNVVETLDPKIQVKSRRTYTKEIKQEAGKVKAGIQKIISKHAGGLVGLTTDMWDDKKQNSYCSLTVHFIDDNFELQRVTPCIKYFGDSRHKSENIANFLSKEIESHIKNSVL